MGGEDPVRGYIGAVGGRRRQTSGSGRAGIVGGLRCPSVSEITRVLYTFL